MIGTRIGWCEGSLSKVVLFEVFLPIFFFFFLFMGAFGPFLVKETWDSYAPSRIVPPTPPSFL